MALIDVKVPDIGDFKDVEVIELLVRPGDTVAAEQSLVTVESDKASMEIPSSAAGVVRELKVKLGDKVSQGSALAVLEGEAETESPSPPRPSPGPAPQGGEAAMPSPAPAWAGEGRAEGGAGASLIELKVPDIGDFKEVAVIEVFIKPGDAVKVEQSLVTVESDKASMEIPATHAGVVKEVRVALGDKVSEGSVLALVEAAACAPAAQAPAPAPVARESAPLVTREPQPPTPERTPPTIALPPQEPAPPAGVPPHASPSIRRLARELGVPLDEVKGSGPKGRITQEDVQSFVQAVMRGDATTKAAGAKAPAAGGGAFPGLLPWPQVDFAKFGAVERKDLSRIKKISAANLHRNWVLIPHVTNHDDADITDLEAFRLQLNRENEKSGVKVTMLAFLIKACVAALRAFPDFNASLDGEQLVLKRYFHVGFAADTPNGLVVPVVKDADRKGILALSPEMAELAKKAREGKLTPTEMSGGCFSISSLGGIGGRYFTPIINAPEVAILGVCRSQTEPKWDGKAFAPRLMLPLSLSWDHRVIDGAAAARFLAYLGQLLADFRRVLL
ncbi:MAG TPA: dihydrolipoyllysine-residue acetyltransferase [Ideonella sp.]|nr:dihydrolipoyllysine-residue acetyltransferase [Ideonella sp.]